MMQFSNVYAYLTPCQKKNVTVGSFAHDWDKALSVKYQEVFNEMLDQTGTPKVVAETDYADIRQQINDYYDKLLTCIKSAAKICIPYSYRKHCSKDLVVAGWNDIV